MLDEIRDKVSLVQDAAERNRPLTAQEHAVVAAARTEADQARQRAEDASAAAEAARGELAQIRDALERSTAVTGQASEQIRVISYEKGTQTPRAPMLRRLADALDVDGFALFRPDTPRDPAMLRTRLGLTQADVAAQLHTVGRAYYSRVEQGTAALHDEDDRRRLAELLQVDLAEVRALTAGAAASA